MTEFPDEYFSWEPFTWWKATTIRNHNSVIQNEQVNNMEEVSMIWMIIPEAKYYLTEKSTYMYMTQKICVIWVNWFSEYPSCREMTPFSLKRKVKRIVSCLDEKCHFRSSIAKGSLLAWPWPFHDWNGINLSRRLWYISLGDLEFMLCSYGECNSL